MGRLYCLLSAVGFGLMAVFAKSAYAEGVSVEGLLVVRFGLAAVVLLVTGVPHFMRNAGSLQAFLANLSVDGLDVTYDSPSVGELTYGWTGRFKRDGKRVDQGSFKRFDNMYIQHDWGETLYELNIDELRLELDVENLTRTMYETSGS